MTNKEETINVLNDYDINFERNTPEEVAEAHEIAIKALEAQPSEDWNAVLDELNRIGRNAFKDDTDYDNLFDFISNLPNVTPQPKTGHWVLSGGYWRCSECKEKALLKLDKATGGYREYEPVRSKYCPECGAKMEEDDK